MTAAPLLQPRAIMAALEPAAARAATSRGRRAIAVISPAKRRWLVSPAALLAGVGGLRLVSKQIGRDRLVLLAESRRGQRRVLRPMLDRPWSERGGEFRADIAAVRGCVLGVQPEW